MTKRAFIQLVMYFGTLLSLFFFSSVVFAGSSDGSTLGDVAKNVTDSMNDVAKLITAVSYAAGIAFALMGMMKLKAHKEQPTQVPLSQPIVLLIIAAGLVFLPSLIKSAGATFWTSPDNATAKGTGVPGLE